MEYQDKFVAFLDVLGFSKHVEASAVGQPSLADLVECVSDFNRSTDLPALVSGSPPTCPGSQYARSDLEFRITQVSDCVIVSAEVSPAGVINLIKHCWNAVMRLLDKGYLCRGYITRGLVWHEDRPPYVVGPGYVSAVTQEQNIAFRRSKKKVRTPFVEVDQEVGRYVAEHTDTCVRDMYSRLVLEEDGLAALFPFMVLDPSAPSRGRAGDVALEAALEDACALIKRLRAEVLQHAPRNDPDATAKVDCYLRALDDKLAQVDRLAGLLLGPAVRLK